MHSYAAPAKASASAYRLVSQGLTLRKMVSEEIDSSSTLMVSYFADGWNSPQKGSPYDVGFHSGLDW